MTYAGQTNIENHMILDLPNYLNEYDCTESISAVCNYCGNRYPIDEMNTMPIDGSEEYVCIDCLQSENE